MKNEKLEKISHYLHEFAAGEENELPKDEFDHEAELLLERINLNSPPTQQEIAKVLSQVFSESFNDSFEEERFLVVSEKIVQLLSK